MTRAISQVVVVAAVVCVTGVGLLAQQSTSSSETKAFEVIAVDGNVLVVRLPEGTRELTVPNDFRFTVDGQQLSVQQLKVGSKGTATITTRTTVTPVTVTEVKNGTVAVASGATVILRTDEGIKSFTQSDVDKRGVKIFRDGKPVQLINLHEGDRLTAMIITSQPPRIVTEKEVMATTAAAGGGGASPQAAAARGAAPAQAAAAGGTAARGTAGAPGSAASAGTAASAGSAGAARTLPATASSWPLLGLASLLLLATGLTLTLRRRLVR